MKRVTVFLFLLISFSLKAQVNYIAVEAKYLSFINQQRNPDLIEDNLRNSEMVVDSIIFLHPSDKYSSAVLANLTYSYFLSKKYALAFVSGLRYFLFSNNSDYEQMVKRIMIDAGKHFHYNDVQVNSIIVEARSKGRLNDKLIYLLQNAINLKSKQVSPFINHYIFAMEEHSLYLPRWAYQYAYFINLGICPRSAYKMTNFSDNQNLFRNTSYVSDLNIWQKFKVFCHRLL